MPPFAFQLRQRAIADNDQRFEQAVRWFKDLDEAAGQSLVEALDIMDSDASWRLQAIARLAGITLTRVSLRTLEDVDLEAHP